MDMRQVEDLRAESGRVKMLAIARNGIRPSYFAVMAQKVYLRARYGTTRERFAATDWAAEQAEDMDSWARRRDAEIWEESLYFAQALKRVRSHVSTRWPPWASTLAAAPMNFSTS